MCTSSNILWTYRVNVKRDMTKRLVLWNKIQWTVRIWGLVGCTGLRTTYDLICMMSKRVGKLIKSSKIAFAA